MWNVHLSHGPKVWISHISLVLQHSLLLMTDRPNATNLEMEKLEELKCWETDLDRIFFSFLI